jgi:hypothetical protein
MLSPILGMITSTRAIVVVLLSTKLILFSGCVANVNGGNGLAKTHVSPSFQRFVDAEFEEIRLGISGSIKYIVRSMVVLY